MDTYGHLTSTVNRESVNKLDSAVLKKSGDKTKTFSKKEKSNIELLNKSGRNNKMSGVGFELIEKLLEYDVTY